MFKPSSNYEAGPLMDCEPVSGIYCNGELKPSLMNHVHPLNLPDGPSQAQTQPKPQTPPAVPPRDSQYEPPGWNSQARAGNVPDTTRVRASSDGIQPCSRDDIPKESRSCSSSKNNPWKFELVDLSKVSNDRVRFCRLISRLMLRFPSHDRETNTGLVWGRVSRTHYGLLHKASVAVQVSYSSLHNVISFTTPVNRTVQSLLEEILLKLDIFYGTTGQYLLKLADSEEFFRNDDNFGMYESIKTYQVLNMEVPLRILQKVDALNHLARDAEDDKRPFQVRDLLGSSYVFSTSRRALEDKFEAYSKKVHQLLNTRDGRTIAEIVQNVQSICSLLSDISPETLEETLSGLQRMNPTLVQNDDLETAVVMLHQALENLLHVFFTSFDSDFCVDMALPSPAVGSVAFNSDTLRVDLAALYRLQPSWHTSYDSFTISYTLTYGSKRLCEVLASENISTTFIAGNKIRCNKRTMFPLLINCLPFESMLTIRLLGSKQGKPPELLRWATLPLFPNGSLVSGSVLLSMSTLVELSEAPTMAFSDGHRQASDVILQLDFPDSRRWIVERPQVLGNALYFTAPCKEVQQKMREVSSKHCLSLLSENEKAFLWSKRFSCVKDYTSLHLVLGSAPQWSPQHLSDIYNILYQWTLQTEEALFLLSDSFTDQNVRNFAVQHVEKLSDVELEEYLPQLVQALKLEWDLNGPLVKILLERALQSVRVAHHLYWLLEDVLEDPRYYSWYRKVQAGLKHCCGKALRRELEMENQLVKVLTEVARGVRTADKSKRKEVLKREKTKISDFFFDGVMLRMPFDPAIMVKGVDTEATMFYNSNAAPLGVTFINADSIGRNVSVICKTGDNLRQDMLVLQIVRVMNRVWLKEGLDMRMVTYRCLATGRDQGLVEVVPKAVTLATIHQEWGVRGTLREDTLEKWFHTCNSTEEAYEEAVMNFLHSCAGWCVVTFVLGICDRHNDNIMLRNTGHMFHIDFGKIMGNAQKFGNIKRDRTPFIFTTEMQYFIKGGGQNPQRYQRFVDLCCEAYNVIRRSSALLLGLLQLMLQAGMPELNDTQDLQYVLSNLRPLDSEQEATSYFTRKIEESQECAPAKLNFLIHSMAQFSVLRRGTQPGPAQQAGPSTNIQDVIIQRHCRRDKEMAFELKVTIDDGFLIIVKTSAQLQTIHMELKRHFIDSTLPQFPTLHKVSFSINRNMSLLNKYLKELFSGPCKGNEYVCRLFLDGPRADMNWCKNERTCAPPQIQLCITYKDNKLSVMIKHLKNIRMPNGASPDAYVATRLRPDPEDISKRKTKTVRGDENPTFNELIEYDGVQTLKGRVLEVTVKSRRAFVAAANVPLEDRKLGTNEWVNLGSCAV